MEEPVPAVWNIAIGAFVDDGATVFDVVVDVVGNLGGVDEASCSVFLESGSFLDDVLSNFPYFSTVSLDTKIEEPVPAV